MTLFLQIVAIGGGMALCALFIVMALAVGTAFFDWVHESVKDRLTARNRRQEELERAIARHPSNYGRNQ